MTSDDRLQKLGGALGWGVVARIARMALGLGASVLVVRGLGAHDYGVLAVLRTTLAFVTILVGGGLTQGLLRYLPAWRMMAGPGRIRRALLSFVVLQAVLWLVLVLVFWLLRPWVGDLSNVTVAGLLLLGVALLFPEVLANTATQIANAYYDSRRVSGAVVISTLAYVVLIAWLMNRQAGVAGVLWAAAGSNLILALWLFRRVPVYLRQSAPPGEAVEGRSPSVATVARFSVPFILIGILNLITWRQSEVLFLGHFRSAAEAGFFDLAYRVPQMVLEFVPGAIWPLVMAGFSEIYTRDPHALQRAGTAYYKLLFLLIAPLSVGGILVGDLAVRFLYGSGFSDSGTICQVFFLIFSISFFTTPLSMVLYVVERPWLGFGIYLISAALNVGLDLLFIPRFGLWGAVLPVSLVILVSPLLYWWILRRIGVSMRPPWLFLGRIYAASAAMFLLWPLRGLVTEVSRLPLLILAGVIVFVIGVRIFRVFGPEEKTLIQRVNPRVWDRLAPLVAGRSGEGSR